MSTLEVLKSCTMQQKSLLSTIGVIEPSHSSLITFDLENHVPHLPHRIAFLVQVVIKGNKIHWMVIDEGASTHIMLVSCWKAISSPFLNQSPNTLESFDGRVSCQYGILTNLTITLEVKTIELEVEVVDENLDYNIFLKHSWTHAMFFVVSSLFCMLRFPHEGKIIIVDQMSFYSSSSLNGSVPYVGNIEIPYEGVGLCLFKDSYLMGTFTLPPQNFHSVNEISVYVDPWIIPTTNQIDSFGDATPLSPLEKDYQEIILASMTALGNHIVFGMNLDTYVPSPWLGS